MSSLLSIVLLTAAAAAHAPVSHPATPRAGQPQGSRASRSAPSAQPVMLTANVTAGWIEGLVTDDHNQPVAGAAVTAQGRDLLIIETDHIGRFEMRGLPAGTYLLRVQGRGFAASRREFVQVVPSRGTHFDVQLRRAAAPVMAPSPGGEVLAAGVGLSSAATAAVAGTLPVAVLPTEEADTAEAVPHDHSSAAWRLRHAKRSVLRDTTSRIDDVSQLDDEDLWRSIVRLDDIAAWTVGAGRTAASAVLN